MTTTQDTTFDGEVQVCCHTVSFWYELRNLDLDQTPELEEALAEEAESRAQELIIEGCNQGELNCLWKGETEIGGWWKIVRD